MMERRVLASKTELKNLITLVSLLTIMKVILPSIKMLQMCQAQGMCQLPRVKFRKMKPKLQRLPVEFQQN
jgi:hypothetical protein